MSYNLFQSLKPPRKRGVDVEVRHFKPEGGSRKIVPGDDGFLFSQAVHVSSEFILAIRVPRNLRNAWVVSVNGRDGKIAVKTKDYTPHAAQATFAKIITSRATDLVPDQGVFLSTKHDGNNLRIILADNGFFEMWEIAIPMRAVDDTAGYFLTAQKLYSGKMQNLGGWVYVSPQECEVFSAWTHLKNFLNERVNVNNLPEAVEPSKLDGTLATRTRYGHRVKYFCLASGLGKAETHQGEALIHWSNIISSDRFAFLEAGQMVTGKVISNGRGLQLTKISAVG